MTTFLDLNADLSTLSHLCGQLSNALKYKKDLPAGSILQIQKLYNVSQSKLNQDEFCTKDIVKVFLGDGEVTIPALILGGRKFSSKIGPGFKIKITKPLQLVGKTLLMIEEDDFEILGGIVPKLYEPWLTHKQIMCRKQWGVQTSSSLRDNTGPPKWRAFGGDQVFDYSIRNLKTTDVAKKPTEPEESEFSVSRSKTINEIMETNVQAKFSKPGKHLLDKDIESIMTEGFSRETAERALNRHKDVRIALKNLKRGQSKEEERTDLAHDRFKKKGRRGKSGYSDESEDEAVPKEYQKPSQEVTLFSFVKSSVPVKDEVEKTRESFDQISVNSGNHDSRSNYGERNYHSRNPRGAFPDRQPRPYFNSNGRMPNAGRNYVQQDTFDHQYQPKRGYNRGNYRPRPFGNSAEGGYIEDDGSNPVRSYRGRGRGRGRGPPRPPRGRTYSRTFTRSRPQFS